MRSSGLFKNIQTGEACYDEEKASYFGICLKTFILLGLSIIVAIAIAFYLPTIIENGNYYALVVALVVASIVGFISFFVGRFSTTAAKYGSVFYAISEGLGLGVLTALVEMFVPGVGIIAVFSTLIIFGVMLLLFATGILRVGKIFTRIAIALGLCAIALTIFTTIFVLVNPNVQANLNILLICEGVCLLYGVITLAFNFEEAKMVVEAGCTKSAEWSVALGLEVSLIYIYFKLIRIIALIAAKRD